MFNKPPLNPEILDRHKDIDWTFIGNVGASFKSHKASQKSSHIVTIQPTLELFLFLSFGIVISGGLGIYLYIDSNDINANGRWGLLEKTMVTFTLVSLFLGSLYSLIYELRRIKYFNKKINSYTVLKKNECQLTDIKAIQLLYTRSLTRGTSKDSRSNEYAYDYQINLILNDNSRINVVSHGSLKGTKRDSKLLETFLNVPILDGINYDYIEKTFIPESSGD